MKILFHFPEMKFYFKIRISTMDNLVTFTFNRSFKIFSRKKNDQPSIATYIEQLLNEWNKQHIHQQNKNKNWI